MISVRKYDNNYEKLWNEHIHQSKNGSFIFDRRYMDYHADRFVDYSLQFFDGKNRLVGVLPASLHDDIVISHGGLTYGGVISSEDMKTLTMLHLFDALIGHLREAGYSKLIYKAVPYIFHRIPAEEDLYALFVNNARMYRRDASSAIYLPERLDFAKGKREGVRKGQRSGLVVQESHDFYTYFEIGRKLMNEKYGRHPVHTCEEMALLSERFPDNIKLHAAFSGSHMLAGVITYIFPTCVHTQYMYNSEEGMEVGALDFIIHHLINDLYSNYRFLSFGVSTENEGRYLNEGLIHQKEMYGARSVVHDFYEIDINQL